MGSGVPLKFQLGCQMSSVSRNCCRQSSSVSVMKKFRHTLSFLKVVNEIKECKVYLLC